MAFTFFLRDHITLEHAADLMEKTSYEIKPQFGCA